MARLSSDDLAAVVVTDKDRAEVATGSTPPPPARRGGPPPSRWLTIIKLAEEQADLGTDPEEIDGVTVLVGPWVQYPKDNQPTVWSQNIVPVRKAFGQDSAYADENDGDYFEITLRDTLKPVTESGKSGNTKGVLWVRKVIVPKGEEQ